MAIIFTRRILSAAVLLGFAWAGCAAPPPRGFGDPTTNGFPNPNTQQKMAIAQQAGGKLPGIQTPKSLGDGSATALQLIAFNELFESAYFTSLLNNLTNNAPGYHNDHRDELVKIFTTVQAVRLRCSLANFCLHLLPPLLPPLDRLSSSFGCCPAMLAPWGA